MPHDDKPNAMLAKLLATAKTPMEVALACAHIASSHRTMDDKLAPTTRKIVEEIEQFAALLPASAVSHERQKPPLKRYSLGASHHGHMREGCMVEDEAGEWVKWEEADELHIDRDYWQMRAENDVDASDPRVGCKTCQGKADICEKIGRELDEPCRFSPSTTPAKSGETPIPPATPKRYDIRWGDERLIVNESPTGEWVRHADVRSLLKNAAPQVSSSGDSGLRGRPAVAAAEQATQCRQCGNKTDFLYLDAFGNAIEWVRHADVSPASHARELDAFEENTMMNAERSARSATLEKIVFDNLPYLENLIQMKGHRSVLMRQHPFPCAGHDFCLMRQAQKGADAIRAAMAATDGRTEAT